MNKIRIWCFNDKTFDKVRSMWIKENRLKRSMLKNFVRVEPFDVDGIKGIDIVIVTKLIKPSHLTNSIKNDLDDEGFTCKDYKVKVISDE